MDNIFSKTNGPEACASGPFVLAQLLLLEKHSAMHAITLELPETFETWDEREIKTMVAAQLYAKGKLTLGQAADVVGVSKALFMELLADCGVSFFNYSTDDLETDLANVQSHRN